MMPKHPPLSRELASLLKIVRFSNKFRSQTRLIWFNGVKGRERNGEHSYQLALIAWYIVRRHLPHLDLIKILLYAMVHDLPETYAGDTPAFLGGGFKSNKTHADKKAREKKACERIENEWGGRFPELTEYIHLYEAQGDEEGRLIYALDKLLSELNIYTDLGRTDKRLHLTLDEKIPYKRPRIASHPFMLTLYDELCRFCEHRPELFHRPAKAAKKNRGRTIAATQKIPAE